uniref:Pyroglutamyl-peptidase 1 n=1 Tax=Cacopsylla melanoneura TaxID=428564 RepID=A0A8D9A1W3_9HEMI
MAKQAAKSEDLENSTLNDIEDTTCVSFKVLVTGFGPFRNFPVNASWEAVSLLPDRVDANNIEIVKEQVEVSYDYVDNTVPALWKKYNPDLVIHVGVSGVAEKITIESCGNRDQYEKPDVNDAMPCDFSCKAANTCDATDSSYEIQTGLDLNDLVNQFQSNKDELAMLLNVDIGKVGIELSCDAGRYLCEYIYYTSLCMDKSRCVFIHVPPINEPYSLKQLTQSLLSIIFILSQQLMVSK